MPGYESWGGRNSGPIKLLIEDFEIWLQNSPFPILRKVTSWREAQQYCQTHGWPKLFLDDGAVEMDSNVVERAIHPIAFNRKNALFEGHDEGARTWARINRLMPWHFDKQAWHHLRISAAVSQSVT